MAGRVAGRMEVKYCSYCWTCQTVGEGLDFISYMQAAGVNSGTAAYAAPG